MDPRMTTMQMAQARVRVNCGVAGSQKSKSAFLRVNTSAAPSGTQSKFRDSRSVWAFHALRSTNGPGIVAKKKLLQSRRRARSLAAM